MTECLHCGAELRSEAKFCPLCGRTQVLGVHSDPQQSVDIFGLWRSWSSYRKVLVSGVLLTVLILVVAAAIDQNDSADVDTTTSDVVEADEEPALDDPYSDSDSDESDVSSDVHPLDQMVVAFVGGYSRGEIQAQMDRAMELYDLPLTEEYYSRAASSLVALRKENGTPEMNILDYMIRSHVPDVNLTFPEAAALSSVFLKAGDR